ncbi:hypothetical protein STEG23_027164 [Scotinomys teguina]
MASFVSNGTSSHMGLNGMSVDEKPDSPMYVYESTVHCANILLGLNDQRKKDILCDVTLIVERKEFRAHRAVLAACSEYFWQALVGQTKDDLVVSLPEEVRLLGDGSKRAQRTVEDSNLGAQRTVDRQQPRSPENSGQAATSEPREQWTGSNLGAQRTVDRQQPRT